MASITSWTRLEPRVRRDEPSAGLEARVRDPLWMLARQWQVGEFTGEDAGSPLQARVRAERAPLTRYHAGAMPGAAAPGQPYDPVRLPLEVLVEREDASMDARLSREAGLHFLRLLDARGAGKYRQAYVAQYPVPALPDGLPLADDTLRLVRLSAGRVPDGARLLADLRAAGDRLPAAPAVEEPDRDRVLSVTRQWLAWLDGFISMPASIGSDAGAGLSPASRAWNPERMEYSFAVAAPAADGERLLAAAEYYEGDLDWQSFNQRPGASLGANADAAARDEIVRSAIPAPVSYRGMPVSRWWEFEDGQVNLGSVDAGPNDLLRVLLLGFALDYGNDWFLVPVALPAGAIYRVTSLIVTDSFGERTLVRPYTAIESESAGARWRMFCLSSDGPSAGDESLLFLPPSLPASLRGEPIEEVRLLRDEVANLAWAVERLVEDAGGRPVDRFEEYQRTRAGSATPAALGAGETRYRLATGVPDYWLPLVPARIDAAQPDIRLVRGRVLSEGDGSVVTPAPLGRLLEPRRPLGIFEEEVPRAGTHVVRRYEYARWADGSGHLWIGRRKSAGRGEGASGLRFDILIEQ